MYQSFSLLSLCLRIPTARTSTLVSKAIRRPTKLSSSFYLSPILFLTLKKILQIIALTHTQNKTHETSTRNLTSAQKLVLQLDRCRQSTHTHSKNSSFPATLATDICGRLDGDEEVAHHKQTRGPGEERVIYLRHAGAAVKPSTEYWVAAHVYVVHNETCPVCQRILDGSFLGNADCDCRWTRGSFSANAQLEKRRLKTKTKKSSVEVIFRPARSQTGLHEKLYVEPCSRTFLR